MKKVKLFLMSFLALSLIFSTFSCAKDASDSKPDSNNAEHLNDDDDELPEGSETYCTITFHSNDGKNQDYVQKFPIGDSGIEDLFRKLKPSKFSREGYIFEGWAQDADATEAEYKDEATIPTLFFIKEGTLLTDPELVKDVHFYAVWTDASKLIITYLYKYKSEDKFTVEVPVVNNKATYKMAECSFEPESDEYAFACWENDDLYPGEEVEFESETSRRITYWARWVKKGASFIEEIRYYKDVDSNEYVSQYYDWSNQKKVALLRNPFSMDDDAEFVGYADKSTATKANFQPLQKLDFTNHVPDGIVPERLYTLWSRDITLTFNSNTGNSSQTTTQTVKSYKPQVLSDNLFTNGDKRIYCWSKDKSIDNTYYPSIINYNEDVYFANSQTLYAIWSDPITVTFNSNEGDQEPSTINSYQRFKVESPKFTRAGYTFIGFATNARSKVEYSENNLKPTGNTTYYAVWSRPITVTFSAGRTDRDLEDVQITADSNVEYYHPNTTYVSGVFGQNEYKAWGIGDSDDPYGLEGWLIEYSDGTQLKSEYKPNHVPETKSFVLYDDTTKVTGIWHAPTTIIFHSKSSPEEEGEDETKIQYGKYSNSSSMFSLERNTFTKEGYTFKHWKLADSNTTYSNSASYSYFEDKTVNLYAIWEENSD